MCAAWFWLSGPCLLFAQTAAQAQLGGRVADETGAALASVSITLANTETGYRHETRSNELGNFAFPFLPPGVYMLQAARPGFSTLSLEGVRLAVHQALELPLVLRPGGPDSLITVTADANRIEVNNSALKYRLTEKQIADLPILIGMNLFERIAFLVPGASNGNRSNLPLLSGLSINGSPAGGVAFSIDGIDNSSMGNWARLAVFAGGALSRGPNADAVQEFTAITANFKAETGARSAHLNLEIKSGENELKGQARSIYLNPALAARDFFDTQKKTGASTTLLGFQLSGPLVIPRLYRGRNRTHFFVDAQNSWYKEPRVGQRFTVSEPQRQGDFSGLPAEQWPIDPRTGASFPGGRIPRERILPQSRSFVEQVIRQPDRGNVIDVESAETTRNNQVTARVDHQFAPYDTLSVSMFSEQSRNGSPTFPLVQNSLFRVQSGGWNLAVNETHTFTNSAVNSLGFGASGARHENYVDGRLNNVDLKREGYNGTSGNL